MGNIEGGKKEKEKIRLVGAWLKRLVSRRIEDGRGATLRST